MLRSLLRGVHLLALALLFAALPLLQPLHERSHVELRCESSAGGSGEPDCKHQRTSCSFELGLSQLASVLPGALAAWVALALVFTVFARRHAEWRGEALCHVFARGPPAPLLA